MQRAAEGAELDAQYGKLMSELEANPAAPQHMHAATPAPTHSRGVHLAINVPPTCRPASLPMSFAMLSLRWGAGKHSPHDTKSDGSEIFLASFILRGILHAHMHFPPEMHAHARSTRPADIHHSPCPKCMLLPQ